MAPTRQGKTLCNRQHYLFIHICKKPDTELVPVPEKGVCPGRWLMAKLAVKETVQHTSCLNCGKLVFDRRLECCPKCGGYVAYISDGDLHLLGRRRPLPVPELVQEDD